MCFLFTIVFRFQNICYFQKSTTNVQRMTSLQCHKFALPPQGLISSHCQVVGVQVLQYDRHFAHSSLYFSRYDLYEVHFASHAEKAFFPPLWASDLYARKRWKMCSCA